jgi:hypothetical protein
LMSMLPSASLLFARTWKVRRSTSLGPSVGIGCGFLTVEILTDNPMMSLFQACGQFNNKKVTYGSESSCAPSREVMTSRGDCSVSSPASTLVHAASAKMREGRRIGGGGRYRRRCGGRWVGKVAATCLERHPGNLS